MVRESWVGGGDPFVADEEPESSTGNASNPSSAMAANETSFPFTPYPPIDENKVCMRAACVVLDSSSAAVRRVLSACVALLVREKARLSFVCGPCDASAAGACDGGMMAAQLSLVPRRT